MKKLLLRALFGERAAGARMAFYRLREALGDFRLGRRYWWSDSVLMQKHDAHLGETCVIVGNGPSLNQTDTRLLQGACSFGTNRIYVGLDKLGFTPTYYVSINRLVIEQCWQDIRRLPMPKFLSSNCGVRSRHDSDAVFLRTREAGSHRDLGSFFSCNPIAGVWEGATVTYVAMQLAYWMGFRKVILIGVDHSFVTKGEPHKAVVSEGDDPNHFCGEYFGKGFRWQLPDLATSELAYRMADFCFHAVGREIVDCTVGGKCPVFRKGDLAEELVLPPRRA